MKHAFFHSFPPSPSPRVLWLREILERKPDETENLVLVACLIAACIVLWIGILIVDFGLILKGWQ